MKRMGKQKKKRNKVYAGADAANASPTVTRISAVNRSRLGQWWFDHKKIVRPVAITVGVVIIVVWLIYELFGLVTGS